jgi:hypothetical protein
MVIVSMNSSACDACGCSIGGDSWGIMPNNYRHFVGLRFQYRSYHNSHPILTDHPSSGNTTGDDYFYRSEIMGRFVLHPRLMLFATLPYRYNERMEEGIKTTTSGMGDASLQLQWMVLRPGCADWKHALQLSAGSEAPTGKFTFSHDVPISLQNGSGSWDWMAGFNYTIRFRNAGMTIEGTRRINGYSNEGFGYDWGNSTSGGAKLFTTIHQDSSATWMPWTGINAEYYETNLENKTYQIKASYTEGHLISWNAGLDYYSSNYGFSLEAGLPLVNQLSSGYSAMKLHLGARVLIFILNNKTQKNKHV